MKADSLALTQVRFLAPLNRLHAIRAPASRFGSETDECQGVGHSSGAEIVRVRIGA
jgi:hypothetical protein